VVLGAVLYTSPRWSARWAAKRMPGKGSQVMPGIAFSVVGRKLGRIHQHLLLPSPWCTCGITTVCGQPLSH
jgi:hypothetical protein